MIVSWRGVGVALEGPEETVALVRRQLPPFYGEGGPVAATVSVRVDSQDVLHLAAGDGLDLSGPDGPEMHRACASRVELVLVDRLPDLVAVHAGVVGTDRGVIVLPGRSMVGKSTLTRAMLDHGAEYWSDEFALLDAEGLVHPYPRAMTLRTPTGSERHVPPSAVAVDAPPRPARGVALLQHGDAWDTRRLTPGEAVMGLIDNCVPVRRDPARALTALTKLAESCPTIKGTRDDATSAAPRLLGVAG